ncbi:MAG TPA: hypothetical protein VH395_09450 [Jatrophihabitantaceae bacterium]|jgi:hypothetical protein
MTIHAPIHQCPKCELRFERKTELDDHCSHDHPEFRHEYPAQPAPKPAAPPEPKPEPRPTVVQRIRASALFGWLSPTGDPESARKREQR